MKPTLVPSLLLAAVALAGCESLGMTQPAFEDEIVAANRALEERFRAGDVLGVADLYTDDALLIGPGGLRVEGREDIDDYWSQFEHPIDWRLEIHEIEGTDQFAWERGTSHLTQQRDGAALTSQVEFLLVWRREPDGAWRIAVDAYWRPVR